MQETLTLTEVSKRLGIGKTTLYRLMDRDPDFVTFRAGGRRLMRADALTDYIAKREQVEREERGLA